MAVSTQDILTEAFHLFDSNGDGYLEMGELDGAVYCTGVAVPDDDLDKVRDLKKAITLQEFLAFAMPLVDGKDGKGTLLKAFSQFEETDGSGLVSTEELKSVMKNLGDGVVEEELNRMCLIADPDSSGKADYKRLIAHFMD